MVTLNFKYTQHGVVEIDLHNPVSLATLLEALSFKKELVSGGFIAVRNNQVIQPEETVQDGDTIIIFPPLSGG